MIPLIDTFEYIRKQKRFRRNILLEQMGVPEYKFHEMLDSKIIPDAHIIPWCEYLELGITDYDPLYQYNARSRVYQSLLKTFPTLTEEKYLVLTNLIYFYELDIAPIIAAILPQILPRIHQNPYPIRNAMDDIDAGLYS